MMDISDSCKYKESYYYDCLNDIENSLSQYTDYVKIQKIENLIILSNITIESLEPNQAFDILFCLHWTKGKKDCSDKCIGECGAKVVVFIKVCLTPTFLFTIVEKEFDVQYITWPYNLFIDYIYGDIFGIYLNIIKSQLPQKDYYDQQKGNHDD